MAKTELQSQRFENKYLVSEATALAVRDFVSAYLELDEFSEGMANLAYPVHSLYVDSPNLRLYRQTINGDKNRFKLRIRYYDDSPDSPTFFEIKRRSNNTISKKRGMVKRCAVHDLLNGAYPDETHMLSKKSKDLDAVRSFCQYVQELEAYPIAHVAYLREAWVSPSDNSVRVTLDRNVFWSLDPSTTLSTGMVNPIRVFGDNVVLELKFTNRFPEWFGDLVHVFNLMQCGAAKYAEGLALADEYHVQQEAWQAHQGAPSADLTPESILLSKGRSPLTMTKHLVR